MLNVERKAESRQRMIDVSAERGRGELGQGEVKVAATEIPISHDSVSLPLL